MLTELLILKEKLKKIYTKHDRLLRAGGKAILAYVILLSLAGYLGQTGLMSNALVLFVLSVLCAFLPIGAISFIGSVVIIGNLYALAPETAAAALLLCILFLLIYHIYGFGYGIYMILIVEGCIFGAPIVPVLIMSVLAAPVALVPASFGYFLYYLIRTVVNNASTFVMSGGASALMTRFIRLFEGTVVNPRLYLFLIAGLLATLTAMGFQKLAIRYSRIAAPAVGALVYLVVLFAGGYFLNIEIFPVYTMAAAVIGTVAAIAISQLLLTIDYTATEYLEFEDEKYFYYVKAVPKMTVSEAAPTTKKVTAPEKRARKEKKKEETSES